MSIVDLYNETVNVQRLTPVSTGSAKKQFTAHITGLICHIQALDDEVSKDITNGFGKEWKLFCGIQDIIEGDRVIRTPSTPVEYRVTGVKSYPNYGENSHMEIRIRVFKS